MVAERPTILATSGGYKPGVRTRLEFNKLVHYAVDLSGVAARAPRVAHVGTASGDQRWFNNEVSEAGNAAGFQLTHLNLFTMPNVANIEEYLLARMLSGSTAAPSSTCSPSGALTGGHRSGDAKDAEGRGGQLGRRVHVRGNAQGHGQREPEYEPSRGDHDGSGQGRPHMPKPNPEPHGRRRQAAHDHGCQTQQRQPGIDNGFDGKDPDGLHSAGQQREQPRRRKQQRIHHRRPRTRGHDSRT
jgi:hypothetical protein